MTMGKLAVVALVVFILTPQLVLGASEKEAEVIAPEATIADIHALLLAEPAQSLEDPAKQAVETTHYREPLFPETTPQLCTCNTAHDCYLRNGYTCDWECDCVCRCT